MQNMDWWQVMAVSESVSTSDACLHLLTMELESLVSEGDPLPSIGINKSTYRHSKSRSAGGDESWSRLVDLAH